MRKLEFWKTWRKVKANLELPVSAFKVWVSLGQVGHLHFLGIPIETFAGELAGYYSEAERLRQWSGIIKPG